MSTLKKQKADENFISMKSAAVLRSSIGRVLFQNLVLFLTIITNIRSKNNRSHKIFLLLRHSMILISISTAIFRCLKRIKRSSSKSRIFFKIILNRKMRKRNYKYERLLITIMVIEIQIYFFQEKHSEYLY
jgi:hypothetical protein